MESHSSLQAELKRVKQELASHKIELHQTRGYLQCILQNSEDMIFATDVDGMLVSFSMGGGKALGYSWEDVAGMRVNDLAEDPVSFEQFMTTSSQDGSTVQLDLAFRHKEGGTVYCDVSMINLTNREGQRVGTVGVCRDITLWKKIQEDLVRIDRLAEIGRIAAGVAHEINNPLAVIGEASGWAGVVVGEAKGLSPEDRQELEKAAKEISHQTKRCRNITHQLLDFARDSAPAKTEFDVHDLLKQSISLLKPDLKHTPIEIDLKFMPEPLRISSDPRLLEQVFVNFITNAIYAVREKGKGRIEIRTAKTDSDVEITFKDNGIGIPAENQQKIFELFYSTKPPGKGTGLGLPICRNIVKKLGGIISFDSKPGVGTSFTVRIPVS
ncbi:MAG: PAS domain S-box protein [Desulfobacterales bacterium]|nr:PAS domain S-box protein [Desulfobacterales bacterium]